MEGSTFSRVCAFPTNFRTGMRELPPEERHGQCPTSQKTRVAPRIEELRRPVNADFMPQQSSIETDRNWSG